MNILFCSAGKHSQLIQDIKLSLGKNSRVITTSNSIMVPSLYFADNYYIVPDITDQNYLDIIIDICKKENIDAITTMLDVETVLLARNRRLFESLGIEVLAPYLATAKICLDKYLMYKFLLKKNINTMRTFCDFKHFERAYNNHEISFPVFIKPRFGRGSEGARIVNDHEELKTVCENDDNILIQEYIDGLDIDVDVYVDTISHNAVSMFAKKKLKKGLGGATQTVSFKDKELFTFVSNFVKELKFNGPIDIDLFYKDGRYYLTEVNPRFGAAYLHAYRCGLDFAELIKNNINGIENDVLLGNYEEDIIMMFYSSAVIVKNGKKV